MSARHVRLGVVTTARGLDASFRTWLLHHHAIGFEHLYVVLDAPDEDHATAAWVRAHPTLARVVTVIPADAAHRAAVEARPEYAAFAADYARIVVVRQMLNVAVVMARALADGVDWLFHLDADELVTPYARPDEPLADYLAKVPDDVDEIIFPNVEAVPAHDEVEDPFRAITTFRRSPYYLRYKQFEHVFTAWNGASGRFKLFNAYITGKSALRLSATDAAFVPHSVHHFLPLRFTANVHIEDEGGPIVRHYPHCGLARFVARFTGFNRARVNTYGEAAWEGDLYSQAEALVREGREAELPALYRQLVCLDDPALRSKLERRGLLETLPAIDVRDA